ncbi:MAG: hypothetical protein IPL59_05510 [Candidatus Competibacteraceae bacterium]|nr:hypothetical protein [Candidatus Competibacteraceae bacterium]
MFKINGEFCDSLLAVVYRGLAIPIRWTLLDKRGNSNTQERIDLLAGFIKQFGKISILGLLADREFVGEKWFNYLKNEELISSFVLRKMRKRPTAKVKKYRYKISFYI